MVSYKGVIRKMQVEHTDPVNYYLTLGDVKLNMNQLIGSHLKLRYLNQINCIDCGRITKKSFAQGFCYPCFLNSPMNSECIIRPELCEAHLGKGRNAEWERKHHMQEHLVYLAESGGLKVGVTRHDQIPTRWLDQGARKAIVIARTPYRQLAGMIELHLKQFLSDKTHWQRMLKNTIIENLDLQIEKDKVRGYLTPEFEAYFSLNDNIVDIEYPVISYPDKIKSIKLDKQDLIEGILTGIRGQYLYFDNHVINIRSHSGYNIALELN